MSRAATFASVLADRSAFRLLAAAAISAYGDWIYVIALGGLLVESSGAAGLTLSTTALHAVALVAAPLGGLLADRVPRRGLMIATDLVRAAVMALLVLVVGGDHASLPLLLVLVALSAASGTVFRVARMSLVPDAVAEDRRAALNGLLSSVTASAVIGGPALGALLAAAGLGAKGLLLLNGASFLASAALLGGVRVKRAGPSHRRAAVRAGLRALLGDRARRALTGLSVLLHVGAGATFVALPLVVLDALRRGESGLGTAFASMGVGIIVGGLAGSLGSRAARPRLIALGVALTGPALALTTVSGWPGLLATCFGLGAFSSLADVPMTTSLQDLVPAEARGAAFSALDALGTLGMLAGAALLGTLAATAGLDVAAAVVGGLVAVGAIGLHATTELG